MKSFAAALAVFICFCFAAGALAQTIQPDAKLQAAIARSAEAKSEEEFEKHLRGLAEQGGKDFALLVPQLVYSLMQLTDAREAMIAAVIADRLSISDVQFAAALVPYLDTSDERLRAQLDNLLGGIDHEDPSKPRDFTAYAEILRRDRERPPFPLVRYMVRVDPETALDTLNEVYEVPPGTRDAIRAARTPVANLRSRRASGATPPADELTAARRSVAELARRPEWWVRLYVVSAIADVPELRAPEILAGLRQDPHELVRSAASVTGDRR